MTNIGNDIADVIVKSKLIFALCSDVIDSGIRDKIQSLKDVVFNDDTFLSRRLSMSTDMKRIIKENNLLP